MWGLHSQLPKTKQECVAHLDALAKTAAKEMHRDIFGHLYTSLTILDTKSASLLQFDSILIAVYSIYIVNARSEIFALWLSAGVISVILSAMTLLNVVWIHWSTTGDFLDPADHVLDLLSVRNRRTVLYRTSWYGAFFGVSLLLIFLLDEILFRLKLPHLG